MHRGPSLVYVDLSKREHGGIMVEASGNNKVVWVFLFLFVVLPVGFAVISSLDLRKNSAKAEAIAGPTKAEAIDEC